MNDGFTLVTDTKNGVSEALYYGGSMPRSGRAGLHSNRLAEIRGQHSRTQASIAAEIGVSNTAYSSWETGVNEMGAETITALATVFGCTTDDILGYSPNGKAPALSDVEKEILSLWARLAPNVRNDLLDLMRTCAKKQPVRVFHYDSSKAN